MWSRNDVHQSFRGYNTNPAQTEFLGVQRIFSKGGGKIHNIKKDLGDALFANFQTFPFI